MKIQMKKMVVSITVTLALLSGAAYAFPPEDDSAQSKVFSEKKDAKRQKFYKELNLSDEQKKALEENKNKNREQMKALFESMRQKRALVREELQKDELNMEKINQLQNELKALQTQMLDYRLERILEVRKILTPEQFKKFLAKMEDRKGWTEHKRKGKKRNFNK